MRVGPAELDAEGLRSRDPEIAYAALVSLARTAGPQAARRVIDSWSGADEQLRAGLVRAVRDEPGMRERLWTWIGAPDASVAKLAGVVLLQADEPDEWRSRLEPLYTAEQPMLHADRRLIPHLLRVLEHGRPELQVTAARWLARIAAADPDPLLSRAVPLLTRRTALFSGTPAKDRELFGYALTLISGAVGDAGNLPLPAGAPQASPEALPIPTRASDTAQESLPIPSGTSEAA